MRSLEERRAALHLVAQGHSDGEVSRRLGMPRTTIRDWRAGRVLDEEEKRRRSQCSACDGGTPDIPQADYAYLLGLYLGDGCISVSRRTYRLRLALDAAYPAIAAAGALAMEAVM